VKGLAKLIALVEELVGLTYGESVMSRWGAGVGRAVEADGLGGIFYVEFPNH